MARKIVLYTNAYAVQSQEKEWKELTIPEFWAFIAFFVTIGYEKRRKCAIARLYTTDPLHQQKIFGVLLPRNRLEAILRNLRFDDKTDRARRMSEFGDRAAAIREFYDAFVCNCAKAYSPSHLVCIDERCIPFCGNCGFLVFMKNKPGGKESIKEWVAADVGTSYAFFLQLYLTGIVLCMSFDCTNCKCQSLKKMSLKILHI